MIIGIWITRLRFSAFEPFIERLFWTLAKAPHSFPDHGTFYAYLFPFINIAGGFLIASGIVLRVSQCPIYLPGTLDRRPV